MLTQSNLYKSAQTLVDIQLSYAQSGRSMSDAALCGAKDFIEWQHYPSKDLVDEASGYEFYYHSHAVDQMPDGEHGHFHVIKRRPGQFHHLIGVALDQQGLPVRLFTTNQWVTGEQLVNSELVIQFLQSFEMNIKGRMAPVTKWLSALIGLFMPEIEMLVQKRDEKIAKLGVELGDLEAALHSKEQHVLTECRIDLMARLSTYLSVVNS